jgi:hypothetical protein
MARTQISFNSIQFNSIFKLIMALQQGSIWSSCFKVYFTS